MCLITRYYLVKVIKDFHNLKKGMSVHILLDDPNRKKYKPSGFLGWIFGTGRPSPAEITEAFNKHYGEGTVTDIIPSDVISIKYKEHGDIIIHYFDNDLNHK